MGLSLRQYTLFFLLSASCSLQGEAFSPTSLSQQQQLQPSAQPSNASQEPNRILYLMQAGHASSALNLYQEYRRQIGRHDLTLVQQIGMMVLDQGFRTRDPELQLLTLFGAGISLNERALYILEEGIRSPLPELQLVALQFLEKFQNDEADRAISKAMSSNFLVIRLEGAYSLAAKKAPTAAFQTDALMCKVTSEILPVFPQLYGMIGSVDAIKSLRKLLFNPNEKVRVSAILSAAKYGRDDLLPHIRTLATQHSIAQQEACAVALGVMKDESSVPKLEVLARSNSPCVRLAALQALYKLGREEKRTQIEMLASDKDLYAIRALGGMSGSEDFLFKLIKNENIQVRINAVISLLERKDLRSIGPLCEVLIRDSRDLAFSMSGSLGQGLSCYKIIPSAQQNFFDNSTAHEVSLSIREACLAKAMELSEKEFIKLAHTLFEVQQNDLVPVLVAALEELRTPLAIELLKKHQQKAGAPLIRNYCNLALYRLKEPGAYADNLKSWVTGKQGEDMISFRPLLPWEMRKNGSSYQLTPQETSRLLVEAYEAFGQNQDDKGIDVLLEAIQNGNSKNKYALAGLLIRAAQ